MIKLGINHMVCQRCIDAVDSIARELNLPVNRVELGSVELDTGLSEEQAGLLHEKLRERGFELVFDRESELVNRIKAVLIRYVAHLEEEENPEKLSLYVSRNLHYNYSYLSKVFSDQHGKTIETYLIELKIERVKEMLGFHRWTLSEIAWKLKYSSVQYLSNQFKKVTGSTVTEYLKQKNIPRKTLDRL